jgi:manganese-dependent inorganic pyrophosphatase
MDMGPYRERRQALVEAMQNMCYRRGYALMGLMITDILAAGTELVAAGEKSSLVKQAFGESGTGGEAVFLKGVMSRKKQVVPVIYEALRKDNII